ncbi:MAG: mannose-6-phosphate isomerase, class I [Rhodoluna sp.]|nr:mannose-6-phosphate isomerase, class I [Rhodoluna sp.]
MLVKITNNARDYAWGSTTLIPDYFGVPATGRPMAEIWFGTHDGSPARLTETNEPLVTALGGKQLPFLLKILAADSPLSIQAHPNSAQAAEGFARENAAGVGIQAADRNYKDDRHKPEMIVALTEFEALCGFKSTKQIRNLLESMLDPTDVSEGLRTLVNHWLELFDSEDGLRKLFVDVMNRRGNLDGVTAELTQQANLSAQFELAARLNILYPGDPGVIVALLMNHVWLEPGEALFLPAGNIHAYLSGLGVEIMAASDNVLRGGLTPKHIDVAELERVLVFEETQVEHVKTRELAKGLVELETPVDDFILYRAELSGGVVLADLNVPGASIVLCTAGEIAVSNSIEERVVLKRGEAAFMAADAKKFSMAGSGTAFLATSTFG